MTMPFEALKLKAGYPARLAEHLVASLNEEPAVDAAWAEELAQRTAAFDVGDLETLSPAEFASKPRA